MKLFLLLPILLIGSAQAGSFAEIDGNNQGGSLSVANQGSSRGKGFSSSKSGGKSRGGRKKSSRKSEKEKV